MTKEREAMKLALEALEYISSHYMSLPKIGCMALAAVEKALAEQPAQQQKEGFASPGGGYVPAIPRPMPLDWKLVPRKATPEMLKAMDECAQEGYDERLYAGMASSVYMAAWDASPVMGTLPEQPAQQQAPVQTTPNFAQLQQIIGGLSHCYTFDSKAEFLRVWIRDWTEHKLAKYTSPQPSKPWVGMTDERPVSTADELPNGFVPLQKENGRIVYAACMDSSARHYKWLMWLHPDGQWVSKRRLEDWEVMQVEDQAHYGIVQEAAHGIKE